MVLEVDSIEFCLVDGHPVVVFAVGGVQAAFYFYAAAHGGEDGGEEGGCVGVGVADALVNGLSDELLEHVTL